MAYIIKSRKGKTENPLLAGVRGLVGNVVIKQYKGKIVIANLPGKPKKRKLSAGQKAKRGLFKEAVQYAKGVLKDPKRKAAYEKLVRGKRLVYHAAVSEYLKSEGKGSSKLI